MRTAQAVSHPRTRHAAAPRAVTRQQNVAPRPRRKAARKQSKAPLPNGLSVMGLLVVTLAAIGGMLIVSLNWQRNAHSLAQEEVALRSSLNHVADERQRLLIEERRASNPQFTASRSMNAGLNEIKLDEGNVVAKPAVKPATAKAIKPVAANAATAKPVPVAPKTTKPAVTAAVTKPAAPTAIAKAPQPAAPKAETKTASVTPTMPPSIAKTASVKAALAR